MSGRCPKEDVDILLPLWYEDVIIQRFDDMPLDRRKERFMDKDELKDVLLKSIHNEAVRLADELSDVCIQMLESRKPKEFEEDFAEAIKRFGAGLMGKSLESIEPQVITIMKGEPHAMRDEDGNSMPIECSGALRGKGKKDVTWDSTLAGVSV